MIITADNFLTSVHGKDCEWLSRQAIIDVMEQYAQKFYANKVQQIIVPNDTWVEEKRKYPLPPNIQNIP